MTIEQLSDEDRAEALDALDEWDYDEARDAITRKFLFADFSEAFAFMTRVALLAETAASFPRSECAASSPAMSVTPPTVHGRCRSGGLSSTRLNMIGTWDMSGFRT